MPDNAAGHAGTDGPTLTDCETLIARIDGTIAALKRERERLEQRAGQLACRLPAGEAHHAR